MADDEDIESENEDLTEGLEAKKTSGKKIVIIVAAVVLLALIGWIAMTFLGGDDEAAHPDAPGAEQAESGAVEQAAGSVEDENALPVYEELGNILVNLNTNGRGIILLRVGVQLELDSEDDREAVKSFMPTIKNDFQVYLRSLRPDDLEGPKGLMRIQEELLVRINQSVQPLRVRKVLFEDFLVTPQT